MLCSPLKHTYNLQPTTVMPLLDLPPELLTLIAQFVGASVLRESVDYLLVAKRWYRAILPVYLSRLPLSDLYLASHRDLEVLPSSGTALGHLIRAKTRRLSICLIGHPCKEPSGGPWHDNTDITLGLDGMKKWKDWHCDWTTVGPVRDTFDQDLWRWHEEMRTLHHWAGRVNKKLIELAAMLPDTGLDEFSFEAGCESVSELGPRWDYLHDCALRSLISSLPPFLNNLTIDLCGTRSITPDRGRDPAHICPLIGDRLPNFQNVRLRLRCICPEVFQFSSSKVKTQPKLKTLLIKLDLPFYPDCTDPSYKGYERPDASPCDERAIPLYKRMIAAGVKSTKDFPGLSMMRISFSKSSCRKKMCFYVADCVRERYMYDVNEVFYYEGDGSEYVQWENGETLQDFGSLQDLLR